MTREEISKLQHLSVVEHYEYGPCALTAIFEDFGENTRVQLEPLSDQGKRRLLIESGKAGPCFWENDLRKVFQARNEDKKIFKLGNRYYLEKERNLDHFYELRRSAWLSTSSCMCSREA